MPSNTKQRSQGGGRTANTEPRLQVFKEFSGCNFQESPRSFTLGIDYDQIEQSDLQMNYVVIQNNAAITSNKTIASRNNLKLLYNAPSGKTFTDCSILVGDQLIMATTDGSIHYAYLNNRGTDFAGQFIFDNHSNTPSGHTWESFVYIDDTLLGATSQRQLWTSNGNIRTEHKMSNCWYIDDPNPIPFSCLYPRGSLEIVSASEWATMDTEQQEEYPFRIALAWSYVTKFGPTKVSDELVFYANTPVSEWNHLCYLYVWGNTGPDNIDILAVEFYYTVDNSSTLLFAGRFDWPDPNYRVDGWEFTWYGYLDATSQWTVGNLIAPTENYTTGAPASRINCIDGRVYFWGGEPAYRLWIGGNSGNLFSVSPGTGGGFVDVEPGTGEEIRFVDKYKTQSGNSIVTMLCDSQNSTKEKRYNLVENEVSLSSEQNMKSWQAEQVAGSVGCKSYKGAIVCEDGLYSVSRYGLALTTMTMEYNSQIRANYVSDPIKPVFTDKIGELLSSAVLLEADGILYVVFGKQYDEGFGGGPEYPYETELDQILFCYDIDQKAWWTYSLEVEEPIIDMIHIDYEGKQEGIGIVTPKHIYLLPTTIDDDVVTPASFETRIETGELSAQKPEQGWLYVSQLEFRFDHFLGDLEINLIGIDQFGRKVNTTKKISHDTTQYDLAEYMRIDLRLQCYKIIIHGRANFRLTHFIAKEYLISNKQGIVWGFDDSQSYRSFGDIHPTFKNYNDIRHAIIP